jgi:hypothetical protein
MTLSKSKATPHSREKNKQDDAQKKQHREKRERERLTKTHTHTHTHPAVENHAVDLRLIQRLTKRDTTLSSRKKKGSEKQGEF